MSSTVVDGSNVISDEYSIISHVCEMQFMIVQQMLEQFTGYCWNQGRSYLKLVNVIDSKMHARLIDRAGLSMIDQNSIIVN